MAVSELGTHLINNEIDLVKLGIENPPERAIDAHTRWIIGKTGICVNFFALSFCVA